MTASGVKTSQWGGKHGHLALIVNEEKYRLIATMATSIVDRQVKHACTDPNTDGKTSNFERIKLSRAQDEKIRKFQLQEETDKQLKEKIIEAVDEDQIAVAASAVKTSQWGGKHGHLALIVNKAKYFLITTIATGVVDIQVKPAGTDPTIDGKTGNFERIKLSRAQDEKFRGVELQEETDEQLKEKIIESVDEEYLGKLKKTTWGTVTKQRNPSLLTSKQRGARSPHWRRERCCFHKVRVLS